MKIKIFFALLIFCLTKFSIQEDNGDSEPVYIVPSAFYFDHDIFMDNQTLNCYFLDFLNFVVYDFYDTELNLTNLNPNSPSSTLHFCLNKTGVSKFDDEIISNLQFYSKYNKELEKKYRPYFKDYEGLKKNYQFIFVSFLDKENTTAMIICKDKVELNSNYKEENVNETKFLITLKKEDYGYSFRHHYNIYYLAGFFGYILIFIGLFMIIYGYNHQTVPFIFLLTIFSAKIFLIILDLVTIKQRVFYNAKIHDQDILFGFLFALFILIGLIAGFLLRNNVYYRKIIIGIYFGYILYFIVFYFVMKTRNNYDSLRTAKFQTMTTLVRLLASVIFVVVHMIFVKPKEGNVLPEKFLIVAMSVIGSYLFVSGITYLGGGIPVLLEFGVFPHSDTDNGIFNEYAHNLDSLILLGIFLFLIAFGIVIMFARRPVKVSSTDEEISRVLKDSESDGRKFDDDDEDNDGSNDDDD